MPLPPDPDGMNEARAGWASGAIWQFAKATGCDLDDALVDLLANLMHYTDYEQGDFSKALRMAEIHYHEETQA